MVNTVRIRAAINFIGVPFSYGARLYSRRIGCGSIGRAAVLLSDVLKLAVPGNQQKRNVLKLRQERNVYSSWWPTEMQSSVGATYISLLRSSLKRTPTS